MHTDAPLSLFQAAWEVAQCKEELSRLKLMQSVPVELQQLSVAILTLLAPTDTYLSDLRWVRTR